MGAAKFHEISYFADAVFEGGAVFESSSFCGDAIFDKVDFKDTAIFRNSKFLDVVSFANSIFNQEVPNSRIDFTDCIFSRSVSFRDALFKMVYPNFSGAVLHDQTKFTAKSHFWPRDKQIDPEQAKASCAVIRHNLGKQGLPEEEHFFFRREMGFAAQIGGWWQRLPYRVFGMVSDFGYSIQRPALWLFGLWLSVAMINHVVLQWAATRHSAEYHVVQAFGLSFANQFPVFGLQARWFSADFLSCLNPWLKALGGAQTVVALPLLFFFALGLRTRFRMR
jgi:hypothetical protein